VWDRLPAKLGGKFHAVFHAVSRAMARTPRSSSLVENLNSRLRNYFTLRRHLGGPYRTEVALGGIESWEAAEKSGPRVIRLSDAAAADSRAQKRRTKG